MIWPLNFVTLIVTTLLVTECRAPPTVIIIGAGASGIAAATKLLDNGFNFTVLEAEQRIGGRLHGVRFGEAVVDLGAQWSHGEQNNTMYELVKDLDLLKLSNFRKRFHYSNEHFDADVADRLFKTCKSIFLDEPPQAEQSVGQFVTETFLRRVSETNDTTMLRHSGEVLRSFCHDILTQKGAFSWYDLSMLNNYDRLKGNVYLNWNGLGHGVVLDVMMKRYPRPEDELPIRNKIQFGREVVKIVWDGDSVVIKCSDKSVYYADHVLLTVSLGVLKSTHDTMFEPALPEDKVRAIENLGFEAVVKVALLFSNKWWNDDDFKTALLCWNDDDLKNLAKEFAAGPVKNNKSWLENLYEFHVVEKNPKVLMAWFTGEFIPEIELLPEQTLIDGITFVLNKFFGKRYVVTKPDKILRHSWYKDPHFRGVYSFETVKSRQGAEYGAVTLSKPLTSKTGKLAVLFAGEATSSTHYATVHGAIEAGYREALRIVDLYK